jgi:hypothetical protein
MGGIYEVRRQDWLRFHDIHTKFHKNWFRHSKVDMGGGGHRNSKVILLFFRNKEYTLKLYCILHILHHGVTTYFLA